MAKVYISSTYSDLATQRQAVADILRKSGHTVIAMEDYVASDQRPLDRCLADVAACEVYIGIFAWRYGYIPGEGNPDQKSITELEYRKAALEGKPRLIFVLDQNAMWQPNLMDSQSGESGVGERIKELRAEVVKERLASFFTTTDQLAALASAAIASWVEQNRQPALPAADAPNGTQPLQGRTITTDAMLVYSAVDEQFSFQLADQLAQNARKLDLSNRALLAEQAADMRELDQLACQSHMAIVVLSDAMLNQMEEQRERARHNLEILRMRSGPLAAICRTASSLQRAAAWGFEQVLDASAWTADAGPAQLEVLTQVNQAIATRLPTREVKTIGLPFIVIAMTRPEAEELQANPATIAEELGHKTFRRFRQLRTNLERAKRGSFVERYSDKRQLWRPFVASDDTIQMVIEDAVSRMNKMPSKWRIKPQYYSFDAVMRQDMALHQIYLDIAQRGCVAIVDEFSAFHPRFIAAHSNCPMLALEGIALVTMSPLFLKPTQLQQRELLEQELRGRLAFAFNRFEVNCDPQCEFNVRDERRLKRWLHSSLSQTLDQLENPRSNQRTVAMFRAQIDELDNPPPVEPPSLVG